ncbi:hypothetical protein MON38_14705 [Hymenobacter sp. DH14]|uniref:Uncharacterized protein n=1 Tax=Hymenobacter cyanobacteriorum TaxID=2926463 RepID=A0A9X1VKG6_9BACT|nr:hypothetical protein [Hymenobacter cyanobacteriorum]MCI1188675.1 hypothetical protein [Hymenobacter cyanobacteriorum]
MKITFLLILLGVGASLRPAQAQASHDVVEARTLYAQANRPPQETALRANLKAQGSGFFGDGSLQPGALRTFDGRYRPVPGLRYHAGLRLLEAQDSINLDSTHLWPVGSLRGFDLGEPGDAAVPVRRFRPRLVKEGSAGQRREFVEVLTMVDAGPLLLAWLYTSGADAVAGRLSMAPLLLVGAGNDPSEPLRPLELSRSSVQRLFGNRAEAVNAYAMTKQLLYDKPTDVARMLDYFNKLAVVK